MANTCHNYLSARGADVSKLTALILDEGEKLDLNKLVPMPEDVTKVINPETEEGYRGERDWAWGNWGSPGLIETTETIFDYPDKEFFVAFESDWTTPSVWFDELCRISLEDNLADNLRVEYSQYEEDIYAALEWSRESGSTMSRRVQYTDDTHEKRVDELTENELKEMDMVLHKGYDQHGREYTSIIPREQIKELEELDVQFYGEPKYENFVDGHEFADHLFDKGDIDD